MKITRLLAYRVELPLREGSYKWSGGKSVDVFDSTIVRVETDVGRAGHGVAQRGEPLDDVRRAKAKRRQREASPATTSSVAASGSGTLTGVRSKAWYSPPMQIGRAHV